MLISDMRGLEEHYYKLRLSAVRNFVAKNDIASRISGPVSLATYIIAMISDRYLIESLYRMELMLITMKRQISTDIIIRIGTTLATSS